jgi:tetratricopeptide (TPR) repeat protein
MRPLAHRQGADGLAYHHLARNEVEALVGAGDRALEVGHWATARDAFLTALDVEETAEALVGLGEALWWLGRIHDSVGFRERAYTEFRRRSAPAQAASTALVLGVHYQANLGNPAAAGGWLGRATRLVEDFGLEELRGWVVLLQAGHTDDPLIGERLARVGWSAPPQDARSGPDRSPERATHTPRRPV